MQPRACIARQPLSYASAPYAYAYPGCHILNPIAYAYGVDRVPVKMRQDLSSVFSDLWVKP
jgi:hypothetical protein